MKWRVPDPVKPPTVKVPKPADALRAVVPASLRDDAEAFALAAFDSGHYPNPVGHEFSNCPTCRAAQRADDLVRHLDAGAKEETVETLSPHVVAAAVRIQRVHRLRMLDEVNAFYAWQHDPTLSNAIRRDDTRKAFLELSDANTLAIAILSQFEAESKAWHDANPVDTYA